MASSGNFSTWTPLLGIKDDGNSGITLSDGNTTATQTHNGIATTGTLAPSSGKFYWEIYYSASSDFSDGHLLAGWQSLKNNVEYAYTKQQPGSGLGAPDRFTWGSHLINYKGGGTSAFGGGYLSSINNVNGTYDGAYNLGLRVGSAKTLQFAGDFDNHKLYFGVDNTWYSLANSGTGSSAANTASGSFDTSYAWSIESTWQGYQWIPACWFSGAASGTVATINAGQDSTFSGRLTAGGNADANGFGDFRYAPPSGFLALCSGNLPISDDIDPAQTDTNISEKQCGAVLYTGNGGSNAITGLGFQPDLVWMKQRSSGSTFSNGVVDSSRGASLGTYFNRTNADTDFSSDFSSFDNDGFTLASGSAANINNSGVTFIGWGWKANGGTTSSNGNGSITSSVQANTKAGFSIVTYTGGGSSGTVGHGLNKAPEFVISKKRSGTQSWYALATPFGQGYFNVSGNGSYSSGNDPFNSSAPTTTVVGASGDNVTNSATYIYYCWHSVEGFSKFSKFEGNGNADGAFVYTGFRPKMLVIKDGDNSERAWVVYDDKRNTFNPVKNTVGWNLNGSEDTSSYPVDFLSNGFKLRTTNNLVNASSTYFYACWGSVPFRYNNTF